MKNQPPAAAPPDGADPSMEEILASIRRILNDEENPAATPNAAEAPPAEDDVLVLDQSMMVSAPDEANTKPAAPEAPPAEVRPPVETPPRPVAVAPPPAPKPEAPRQQADDAAGDAFEPPKPAGDLVAPEAAAAAASSVGSLLRTLSAGRSTLVHSGGPTLEDIVRAELRPLLKEWLDANLPPMVERLVRAEIERVVGRFAS